MQIHERGVQRKANEGEVHRNLGRNRGAKAFQKVDTSKGIKSQDVIV